MNTSQPGKGRKVYASEDAVVITLSSTTVVGDAIHDRCKHHHCRKCGERTNATVDICGLCVDDERNGR